jgi:hypothetical protein
MIRTKKITATMRARLHSRSPRLRPPCLRLLPGGLVEGKVLTDRLKDEYASGVFARGCKAESP